MERPPVNVWAAFSIAGEYASIALPRHPSFRVLADEYVSGSVRLRTCFFERNALPQWLSQTWRVDRFPVDIAVVWQPAHMWGQRWTWSTAPTFLKADESQPRAQRTRSRTIQRCGRPISASVTTTDQSVRTRR